MSFCFQPINGNGKPGKVAHEQSRALKQKPRSTIPKVECSQPSDHGLEPPSDQLQETSRLAKRGVNQDPVQGAMKQHLSAQASLKRKVRKTTVVRQQVNLYL